jgi:hypothetical protein
MRFSTERGGGKRTDVRQALDRGGEEVRKLTIIEERRGERVMREGDERWEGEEM